MSSGRGVYKSSERVEFSSSDDESPALIHLERSLSPVSSVSSSSSGTSSLVSSPQSSIRTPSPDLSSYHYIPPASYELSTSKERSIFPDLGTNDELVLLRIPKGVSLKDDMRLNFRKRKVRIGEDEWKLLEEKVTGDIRMIQPVENSDNFEFSI